MKSHFKIKEEFLHYIWKNNLFNEDTLIDSEGNKIIVEIQEFPTTMQDQIFSMQK